MLSLGEKRGGLPQPDRLLASFNKAIDDSGLMDLNMEGYPFTWERSSGSLNRVEEKLDRGLATLS